MVRMKGPPAAREEDRPLVGRLTLAILTRDFRLSN
jgi:hypothetical protein